MSKKAWDAKARGHLIHQISGYSGSQKGFQASAVEEERITDWRDK